MKYAFKRILCSLLCLCLLLTLASCKSTQKSKKDLSKKPGTSEQGSSSPDSSENGGEEQTPQDDILDGGDIDDGSNLGDEGSIDDGYIDDGFTEDGITVNRPEALGNISVGYKIKYDADDLNDSDLDDPSFDDDWDLGDIGDIEGVIDVDYEYAVQIRGKAVSGKTREINVDNRKEGILFDDYCGYGCNVFPTQSTLVSQIKANDSEAFLEIQAKRFNDAAPRYARMWFQNDWMTTNEVEKSGKTIEYYADKVDQNPDYINYLNGKYDFNNEYMQSTVDYCKMLEEAGTEIYVAFGWKVASRIQDWFCEDPVYKRESAPKDLQAYANQAAALFKYMRNDIGLTNFNILSFYNEPHRKKLDDYQSTDYATVGDKRVHWYNMCKTVRTTFKADPELDDVLFYGVDHSGDMALYNENYVTWYMNEYGREYLDAFTFHHYIYENIDEGETAWDSMYERFNYCVNRYNTHPVLLTEYFAAEVNQTEKNGAGATAWTRNDGFDSTSTAYIVASANTGIKSVFKWAMVGGYLGDPLNFDPANTVNASWFRPTDHTSTQKVNLTYYCEALTNTYIEPYSNVHKIDWTGDDIRCSAFTSKDGKNFSLLIESEEEKGEKTFKINLKKSLSATKLYVYRYHREIEENGQATIPPLFDTINVSGKSFQYSVDDKYGTYIISTKPPVKQIELHSESGADAVYSFCNKDGSVKIIPSFVDNSDTVSKNTVKWEIKRYAGAIETVGKEELKREDRFETGKQLGSISVADNGTVTYTPAADAKKGDLIAIRCSLKSDPDRFASAIIEIQ